MGDVTFIGGPSISLRAGKMDFGNCYWGGKESAVGGGNDYEIAAALRGSQRPGFFMQKASKVV